MEKETWKKLTISQQKEYLERAECLIHNGYVKNQNNEKLAMIIAENEIKRS